MNHSMAIRAYWNQVADRIRRVPLLSFRQRGYVVNMNEPLNLWTIVLTKRHSTGDAAVAKHLKTLTAYSSIALESGHSDSQCRAFPIFHDTGVLFRYYVRAQAFDPSPQCET